MTHPYKSDSGEQKKRMSSRDQRTFTEFVAIQKAELNGKGSAQQLLACMKKADFKVLNDSTLRNLYKKIDVTVDRIL